MKSVSLLQLPLVAGTRQAWRKGRQEAGSGVPHSVVKLIPHRPVHRRGNVCYKLRIPKGDRLHESLRLSAALPLALGDVALVAKGGAVPMEVIRIFASRAIAVLGLVGAVQLVFAGAGLGGLKIKRCGAVTRAVVVMGELASVLQHCEPLTVLASDRMLLDGPHLGREGDQVCRWGPGEQTEIVWCRT